MDCPSFFFVASLFLGTLNLSEFAWAAAFFSSSSPLDFDGRLVVLDPKALSVATPL